MTYFVTPIPAMIEIDPKQDLVGFWNAMQDSEYKSQNEIKYSLDTIWF
jgi:hypothetical protein